MPARSATPRTRLLNTAEIELWPAHLLHARGNADARILARAGFVLRRKRDGRYLAAVLADGLLPLVPRLAREPGLDAALDALDAGVAAHARGNPVNAAALPLHRLHERLLALGVDADDYAARTGLALVAEPEWLAYAGRDRFARPLWLTAGAARAWRAMRHAAAADGVALTRSPATAATTTSSASSSGSGRAGRRWNRSSPSTPRPATASTMAATPWTSAPRASRRRRNRSRSPRPSPGCRRTPATTASP